MKQRILLLDDEESLIKWLSYALEQKGYDVFATTEPDVAITKIKHERFDCIISDIKMPKIDGFKFLGKVRSIYPHVPVIFITAYGSMESAIKSIRDGISDYILKPFSTDEILDRIKTNLSKPRTPFNTIIGSSKQIQDVLDMINKIAATDTTVLILGESGTGKELIAREIHNRSKRLNNNFVSISCAALPETLLESELFGYKKGAFTGAATDKDGLFKTADKGSFFLDEIGDAPSSIQMKLLRFLEQKEIVPLGSTKSVKIDVRLIAATNKDLMEEVKKGKFREDLFYRLNVIPLMLPPLRQRKDDIPVLADHFLSAICEREALGEKKLLKTTSEALKKYKWPGNIRELRHVIERSAILSDSYYIKPEHLGLEVVKGKSLNELQEAEIKRVLQEYSGNISKAAKVLGVGRATLYRKIKAQKLQRKKKQRK
jgi:two-component system nitrogen regulation response regulator NtrX